MRLINADENPAIRQAKSARDEFTSSLSPLIASLHESDFEVLVDLLFQRLGWVRVSSLGGTQKDTDLILEQPATKARAIVQVKSAANQSVLDDYADRLGGGSPPIIVISSVTAHGAILPPTRLPFGPAPTLQPAWSRQGSLNGSSRRPHERTRRAHLPDDG